uniref:Transposable element Tc1 transposase n=1 Tax=Bactrocera latifrons TaxID=174628 RepID=A0A0K8UV17_BACLA
MGRGKEIHLEVRKLIIKLYLENKSLREIGKVVGKSHSSVQTIIKSYINTGNLHSKPRSGRPKILTPREERNIVTVVSANPIISAVKLTQDIYDSTQKKISPQTVRNVLYSAGYHGRVARRKPYISKVNKEKRFAFAIEHVNKPNSFWENIIFSDESKFNIFGSDGAQKVWRKVNEEFQEKNLLPTVKHGGGNVMVWGCMAASGVGQLEFITEKMDKYMYLNILKNNLRPSVLKLGLDSNHYYFQQDNDPKHTSYLVREWLLYNCKQLHTPPQSPDINPIEHIWDLLEKRIRKHRISSKESLKAALSTEWAKITENDIRNLVKSMPRRLQAVITAKGGPTKY